MVSIELVLGFDFTKRFHFVANILQDITMKLS